MKKPSTMIIILLIFIWILQNVILHYDIASNKQIETCELYNMNLNSIIDFPRLYNKNKVTLYGIKFNPDFAFKDE